VVSNSSESDSDSDDESDFDDRDPKASASDTDDKGVSKMKHKLELQEYDHSAIPLDAFIIVYGKRRFGKTTWTRFSLSECWWQFPDGGYVFTYVSLYKKYLGEGGEAHISVP
jgi:hypothetical protein